MRYENRTLLQHSLRLAKKSRRNRVKSPTFFYHNSLILISIKGDDKGCCEGCESKKCEIPVMRARERKHPLMRYWELC